MKNEQNDELIIGVCGGVGADLRTVVDELKRQFERFNFDPIEIKLTKELYDNELVKSLYDDKYIYSGNDDGLEKLDKKMNIGNHLCKRYGFPIHAQMASALIRKKRLNNKEGENSSANTGRVYIINQLKRPQEYYFLKKIYRRSFLLIGVFQDEKTRLQTLINYNDDEKYERKARKLILRDEDEKSNDYGQRLRELFSESHFIVNSDLSESVRSDIGRFVEMLFSYNFHTPSIAESCIYIARNVSLRSADLSRQVGAVMADDRGNILATGFNDVPKPGGGVYHAEDEVDRRDFVIGHDSNKRIMDTKINNIINIIREEHKKIQGINPEGKESLNRATIKMDPIIRKELENQLEYSRCVHAEEAAICDAALRGVELKNAILYCTTFPCHLCAKHIIAAGIKEVIYIEPYPKSKVKELFLDTIKFRHFTGVKPRTFRHVFNVSDPEADRRKNKKNGQVIIFGRDNEPELIYSLRILHSCYYRHSEDASVELLNETIEKGKYGADQNKKKPWDISPNSAINTSREYYKNIRENINDFLNKTRKPKNENR